MATGWKERGEEVVREVTPRVKSFDLSSIYTRIKIKIKINKNDRIQ